MATSAHAAFNFAAPTPVDPPLALPVSSAQPPDLALSETGTALAVWESTNIDGSADIYYCKSTDFGITWNTSMILSPIMDSIRAYRTPAIATDDKGNWIVVWAEWTEFQFAIQYTIQTKASTDDGDTWGDLKTLETVTLPKPGEFWSTLSPTVETDRAGTWIVAWDGIDPNVDVPNDSDIVCAHSIDNGATWSALSLINPATNFIFDTSPHLVASEKNKWIAVWRTSGRYFFDARFVISRSSDGGHAWSTPTEIRLLGGDFAFLGDVATDRKGTLVVATHKAGLFGAGTSVFTVRSADTGQTWSPAFDLTRGGEQNMGDATPAVATDRRGHWLALWWLFSPSGGGRFIRGSSSDDNGGTWSLPQSLYEDPDAETPALGVPVVQASALGNWLALWPSTKPIDEDTYENPSIYFAPSDYSLRDDVQVLAPNGFESIEQRQSVSITWLSTGSASHVRIELLRDGALDSVLAESIENDGAYNWNVPKSLEGRGYKIRIVTVGQPAVADRSDNRFRIVRRK